MAMVLIVEDEDSLRETLSRYLMHEGHQVIAAASGHEALEAAFDASPDVLIADWMLKNHIHGLHVSEVFRGLHPRLNTILITGFPSSDLVEESDRRGVSRLLEKPFDLAELHSAVDFALTDPTTQGEALGPPIAAMAISASGALEFATDRASELLAAVGIEPHPLDFEQVVSEPYQDLLTRAERDWVEAAPASGVGRGWLVRSRPRPGNAGWLAVLCPRDEEQRRNDPRLRILLGVRTSGGTVRTLDDHPPVVVIERDGVVRRLLVSQLERVGAICYPSDDLQSAIRLLAAEPRVRTVLVDFAMAGSEMESWVRQIRAVCPEASIVGTGGVGAEAELLAQGVERVLRKPWRINDLLSAVEG